MTTIADIAAFLQRFAPAALAEEWDNVGLLAGDRQQPAQRVMTCLTITPDVVAEARQRRAELIVSHHPLPFRALKRITTDDDVGRLLWQLAGAGTAIYSPHTAFDSAANGINQQLAEGLGLIEIAPLVTKPGSEGQAALGAGRHGRLATRLDLESLALSVKQFLRIEQVQLVGRPTGAIERVAVACGSGGEFLESALAAGCQCLVTGETSFHTCLAAEAAGCALVLAGHYATERFAVERLAEVLAKEFSDLDVWASRAERDPLRWC
ncbi:MAG TPA: Nif3-like dinuclear metal center hexameric protein [Pirellulales bacterium]